METKNAKSGIIKAILIIVEVGFSMAITAKYLNKRNRKPSMRQ